MGRGTCDHGFVKKVAERKQPACSWGKTLTWKWEVKVSTMNNIDIAVIMRYSEE